MPELFFGSVFVDDLRPCQPSRNWRCREACRLFVLPGHVGDLEQFARRLGLPPQWLQSGTMPHYDLTRRMRERAIVLGALEAPACDVPRAIRAWREFRRALQATALTQQQKKDELLPHQRVVARFVSPQEFADTLAEFRQQMGAR